MKKLMIAVAAIAAISAFAAPRGPSHSGPGPSRGLAPAMHHVPARRPVHASPPPHHSPAPARHHSPSVWGRGGRNFWPGFVGGLVGSAIVQPAPIIVTPPPPGPYVRQIWVEGHYEMQVINGTYMQVWIPGRWVIVQ